MPNKMRGGTRKPASPNFEIFKDLVEDEDDLFLKELKNIVKHYIRISRGRIVLLPSARALADKDRIVLYSLGKYIAAGLGVTDSDIITPKEIHHEVGIKPKVASARLSELKDEYIYEPVQRGQYRVIPRAAAEYLKKRIGTNGEDDGRHT